MKKERRSPLTEEVPELWPIFICYRRSDGGPVARRLYEILDKWQTEGPEGAPVQLDVFFDQTMPGVEDWRRIHQPYLEKARALIVVCTPGAKIVEGKADWVHREIEWWLAHRGPAPILIDALKQGLRYVPDAIASRWPDIQRITLFEEEWSRLSGAALAEKTSGIRRQVIGTLLPTGAEVYAEELEAERQRARLLRYALAGSLLMLAVAIALGIYAYTEQLAAQASLLDSRAASQFAESRLIDARLQAETLRRNEIRARISTLERDGGGPPSEAPSPDRPEADNRRLGNLVHELAQIEQDRRQLRSQSEDVLRRGREFMEQADNAWSSLERKWGFARDVQRSRPEPPYIFSIELINAGPGESILLHYGTPDATRLVMINSGPGSSYRQMVQPRLAELKEDRFRGEPIPLELFIVGDRDEAKVGGLLRMLRGLADVERPDQRLVLFRGIWANIFREQRGLTLRGQIRALIDRLEVPLNQPFDNLLLRPNQGRAVVTLPGGLEISVLGPAQGRVRSLHELTKREAERRGDTVEGWSNETFSRVRLIREPRPLASSNRQLSESTCQPSENARRLSGGRYADTSVPNLASSILLFRFRDQTFLHTGDARGDLILEGLGAAGLLDGQGRAHVDLMSIPHQGSDRNVTMDFFDKVRADGYLFSGNGRFGNPEIATVAALIAARGCAIYRMYFVNRNEPDDEHGAKLDEFFHAEQPNNPNYRRIFRSPQRGSVIVDLLDSVRY